MLALRPEYLERRGYPESPEDLLHHDCLHYNLISEREEWTFLGDNGEQTLADKGQLLQQQWRCAGGSRHAGPGDHPAAKLHR